MNCISGENNHVYDKKKYYCLFLSVCNNHILVYIVITTIIFIIHELKAGT